MVGQSSENINMRKFIVLLSAFLFCQICFSQQDSISKVKVDSWYTPTADGTGYTMKVPTLEEVLDYFQNVDAKNVDDRDRTKIRHYTETFVYYIYPKGNADKDKTVSSLINLLINHRDLHLEYPKVFIKFFYKNHQYFNEEQRSRISSALVEPIGSSFENYYSAINLYQIKEFVPAISSLLRQNVADSIKSSVLRNGILLEYSEDFKLISVLANLDLSYQDTLLDIIKHYYSFMNNAQNKITKHRRTSLAVDLYAIIIKESLSYLTNKESIVEQTLYLLDEESVLVLHSPPGVECAYMYYEYMIIPLLMNNKKAMDEFFKMGGNIFFRSLFEKYRTPERMRAALIEFGILDK